MKIREVRIQNFRNFGPALRTISFVDTLTGQARPLTVLVGSNGSGKSTILQTIEGLLDFAVTGYESNEFCSELRKTGLADLDLDFGERAPENTPSVLRIALGRQDRTTTERADYNSNDIALVKPRETPNQAIDRQVKHNRIKSWVDDMLAGNLPFTDGLLFFPHQRWQDHEQKGAIAEPTESRDWLFHFTPNDEWEGSLSQLWVWQNYLDLEQARDQRPNLTPFVAAIETILGAGRKVVIRQGRVTVTHPTLGPVELHQLPSGEKQILMLFGEIIRRLRPGAVLMIDEIEISLHPALQRAVLFHLRKLARDYDLQIIITTHSMEIVSAVAPEEIINLDDMVLEERARAHGAGE